MAVSMGPTSRYLWQGLSTDIKPSDSRVNFNDVFLETDTNKWWVWTGSSWVVSNGMPTMRAQ